MAVAGSARVSSGPRAYRDAVRRVPPEIRLNPGVGGEIGFGFRPAAGPCDGAGEVAQPVGGGAGRGHGSPPSVAPGQDGPVRQPSALARKSKSQPSGACVTLRR